MSKFGKGWGGEDGPAMWIIINISKYYYKSGNVVKGGGVKLIKLRGALVKSVAMFIETDLDKKCIWKE